MKNIEAKIKINCDQTSFLLLQDVRPVLTLPIKLYKVCEITESDNVDKQYAQFAFKLSDNSRSQHIFSADNRELMKR